MKNVGVPLTPLRTPLRKSSRTRAVCGLALELVSETREVETERVGVSDQVRQAEAVLVREQQVVHLPEPSLGSRRLGRLGRVLGVRVDCVSGKWR